MRVILVLAAVAVTLGGLAAASGLLDGGPPRGRAQQVVPPPERGPFALAERRPVAAAARERAIADLARRLQVDAVLRGTPEPLPRVSDTVLVRRMLQETCRGHDRLDECHQAVSSAAIRRIWSSMAHAADPVGKAERLLTVGQELALTPMQVRNSIRAELDEQLTRAVGRRRLTWRRRDAALDCFDTPARCAALP